MNMRHTILFVLVCNTLMLTAAGASRELLTGVLMGMALDDVHLTDSAFRIKTTGAEFDYADGVISCWQRIPSERETARIIVEDDMEPFLLDDCTDFACLIKSRGFDVQIHGDSVLILRAKRRQQVSFQGLLMTEYDTEHEGRHLFIDETGGFGIYPVGKRKSSTPDFAAESSWSVTWDLDGGDEVWVSVFPPRPYNYTRSFQSLAHEGMREERRHYPGDELIEATAQHCDVLAIPSYIFPGGDRPPWRIPRFQPRDKKNGTRYGRKYRPTAQK